MLIKLIIADFDGTIVNTSSIHFEALNQALSDIDTAYCITKQEDLIHLGTKPTKEKLKIISKIKNLPVDYHEKVLQLKKQYTLEIVRKLDPSAYFSIKTYNFIKQLKDDGFLIYLASNTNRDFINLILEKINLRFDNILCNTDVVEAKPHSEMYMRSFLQAGVNPEECVILEDSITGQEAAIKSGAHLYPVESPSDLNYNSFISFIKSLTPKPLKWYSKKINVIVPLAGEGSRFKNAGWTTPKPFIDVNGLPMVGTVIKDLNIDAQFTFIIKQEHDQEYHLTPMLKLLEPTCNIVYVSGKQSGAATTILQVQHIFDNDNHLLIVNGDQMWDWQANVFYHSITQSNIDGSIVVFQDKTRNPKWSFAKLDQDGFVSEVAEKKPISDLATSGIYYFGKGSDFVKYAEQMIEADDRVNNEFYVCPVYNYLIKDGKKINTFTIDKFWPTGTPEELEYYLANRKMV